MYTKVTNTHTHTHTHIYLNTYFTTYFYIGVRGMPKRDIESLGVMGWGLDAARRFFRRRRRRRPP